MIPQAFEYTAPDTLEEAARLLAANDDAKVLTGGHSLIPMMKLRLFAPGTVVDLRKIGALRGIRTRGDALEIGAAATHAEIAASADVGRAVPVLAETAAEIGDPAVRNAGTIGGSVVHADPASDWPAAMLATDASMVLFSASGERVVPASEFFVGMMESAASAGEILTAIRVPIAPAGTGACYEKIAQSASGFALAGVCVQLSVSGGRIRAPRVGITGVADHAYRPADVETALDGCATGADDVDVACARVTSGVDVLRDIHAGEAYRVNLARVLTRRAVLTAISRAGGRSA